MTYKFDRQSELLPLQELFISLTFTERAFCNTAPFIEQWHGWYQQLLNPREQHDAAEFLQTFLDQLPNEISFLFEGTQLNILKGIDDDYQAQSPEQFLTIGLSIKGHKRIQESIKEFLEDEVVPDYDVGGRKINVRKMSRIEKMPAILAIQLKRFEYDMKTCDRYKIDDFFEFPMTLDVNEMLMNPEEVFCIYRIAGIVLHHGIAQAGHYFSFIKKSEWWKFNDENVIQITSEEDVSSVAFGKREKTSAYVIIYVREDFELFEPHHITFF
jgi:ubiquitin C-terminal hydrolase